MPLLVFYCQRIPSKVVIYFPEKCFNEITNFFLECPTSALKTCVKHNYACWVTRQMQFGFVVVESIDHLLLYLSGRVDTGVRMSLHGVCVMCILYIVNV